MRLFALSAILVLAGCKKEKPPLFTPRPAPVISLGTVNPPLIEQPRTRREIRDTGEVRTIPAGATIRVRNNEPISLETAKPGESFSGTIMNDVADSKGSVAIRHGSVATLIVLGPHALDIGGVEVGGHHYGLEGTKRAASAGRIPLSTILSFHLDESVRIREIP
jgi:hypothetical protein